MCVARGRLQTLPVGGHEVNKVFGQGGIGRPGAAFVRRAFAGYVYMHV